MGMYFIFNAQHFFMRNPLRSYKASCYLLSLLYLCCWLVQPAHAQQAVVNDDVTGQLLLTGLTFCFPQAKEMTTNVVSLHKITSGAMRCPYLLPGDVAVIKSARQTPTDNSADLLKLIDSLYMAGIDYDSMESKETITNSLSTPEPALPAKENKPLTAAEIAAFKSSGSLFDAESDMLATKYAEMMSAEPEDVHNYPLYKFIDQWYGTRYKLGGTDNNGIDCSAFAQKLYSNVLGITIPRTARQQHKNCEVIKDADEAMEGDLVFFRIHRFRISHVGVYLANGYFVHASRSRGIIISSLSDKYWQRRYASCGRMEKGDHPAAESDFLQ